MKGEGLATRFGELWNVREEVLSARDILIQAKALILCALPYKSIPEKRLVKTARIGREVSVAVAASSAAA